MTLLLPGLSPSLSLSLRRGIFLLNCAAIGSVLLYFNSEEEFTSSSSTSSSIEQTSKREKCKMHSTRLSRHHSSLASLPEFLVADFPASPPLHPPSITAICYGTCRCALVQQVGGVDIVVDRDLGSAKSK